MTTTKNESEIPKITGEENSARHSKSLSGVIADHYNNAREYTQQTRQQSRIFHMRAFNNWIKSSIIEEFIELAKEDNNARPDDIRVLDIGCGKGGDLRKYRAQKISYLLCTDIADTSLERAKERYNEIKEDSLRFNRPQSRLFDCDFVHADSTRETLHDKLPRPNTRFDVVLIQFAYHYSFESLDQALKMLKNASDNLRTGGYFVGTTVDSYRVINRIRKEGKPSFGNDIYSITFPDSILDPEHQIEMFGNKYNFHLDDVVDCPEFLVYFPLVVRLAKQFNLELVYRKNFAEYYLEKFDPRKSKNLMHRMKSLQPYPLEENLRSLDEEELSKEYAHAEQYLRKHPEIREQGGKIGTLSASEWEVISLYIVFAFKKIRK